MTGFKKFLVESAIKSKLENLKKDGSNTHALWDALVFNKVKAKFGGSIRIMVTGSAPINQDIHRFMRIALCCDLVEGYG